MAQRAWETYKKIWEEWKALVGLTLSWPFVFLGEAV
jgi:hypothetical protein